MTTSHLASAAFETLKICLPTLAESVLGTLTEDRCDRRLATWSHNVLHRAGVQLEVVGREHLEGRPAMVVMSNHQSLYDIPVIFAALGRRVRMVAKKELFRVPIWAGAMRRAGFVPLDRSDHERALSGLQLAREQLDRGTDIWISPEGTRSASGKLGSFKKGGFHLAREARAAILPVTLLGTDRVLPARGKRVSDGQSVRVVIAPPIATDPAEPIEALMDRVRAAIAGAM